MTAPRRLSNEPQSETKSSPLKADRPYREIVTAMVVETLQLFCGLSDKDAWLTFREAISQNKLVGDPD